MTESLKNPSHEQNESLDDIEPSLRRAYEVEQAIDPEHTLPEVEMVPNPRLRVPKGLLVTEPKLITHEGNTIGECVVVTNKKSGERWFHGVNIEEDYQGKGFGLAAYKETIEQAVTDGYSFRTEDYSQTENAKKIWERLRDLGLAEVKSEFTPAGGGRYVGEYVIKP